MKVLLLSHGEMAKGMYDTASMIIGELKNISYVMLTDSGIQDFEARLSEEIDKGKEDKMIFLTDIQGGSPFGTLIKLVSEKAIIEKSIVISGMNLPLLISLALEQTLSIEKIEEIVEESKEALQKYSFKQGNGDEDEVL